MTSDTEKLSEELFEEIFEDVILALCFEVHRSVKLGFFFLDENENSEEIYEIIYKPGKDIFGQQIENKKYDCIHCPICEKKLQPKRFARHLADCMGLGRKELREATKKLKTTAGSSDSDSEDSLIDSAGNGNSGSKKNSRRKRGKNSPRRTTKTRSKIGSSSGNTPDYQSMTHDEKYAILNQTCGVVSKHTKKICMNSHKCSQHTEKQRQDIRDFVLRGHNRSDVQIDIDTVDENPALNYWDSPTSSFSRSPLI